jgi:ketosteroid isomerase-like protein
VQAVTAHARALAGAGLLALALACPAAAQSDDAAQSAIRAALTQWMADFNAGQADKVCALFAPDLIAQYRGQPERGYDALCDLLKRSLADRGKSYRYALAIKEILVAGDLAVVRLTWTFTVQQKDPPREVTAEEPGMDIFPPTGRRQLEDFALHRVRGRTLRFRASRDRCVPSRCTSGWRRTAGRWCARTGSAPRRP